MPIAAETLKALLARVSRPARYIGGEWNSIKKDWNRVRVRMAFAFPDVYEVGMSHLGMQILYGLVNQHEDYLMERVFAPWPDFEEELRARRIPLFSLESRHPLSEFDLVGFTLQYEMSYTNLLNMLHLGGIPLHSRLRGDNQPLVIAGGPGSLNPEPLADFIDAFVLGEGEEVLPEILAVIERHKGGRPGLGDRQELLRKLAGIEGVYIPSFYRIEYHPDGRVKAVNPLYSWVPARVRRRLIKNLDRSYFPRRPVVPYLETVHDRIMLEVFRGCQRGCRFCQAGMIYRPTRERSLATLLEQAASLVGSTGYDEISLTSLSTGDYSAVKPLIKSLIENFREQGVSLSLPSLRIDTFSVGLAEEVQKGRKTGLTFAPEAGTQRLRDVINKGVSENDLLEAAEAAFQAGWSSLKLYFMIGLPTEQDEDLDGIASLVLKVAQLGSQAQQSGRLRKRPEVVVSVSNFVPKAHTPFQWEGQTPVKELRRRQEYLRQRLRDRRVKYNWHDPEMSFWEAVLARGDRLQGRMLELAWKKGCRFDGWSEYFNPQRWREAAAEAGLNPEYYASRCFDYEELLPWDHLESGVSRSFLISEHRLAREGRFTEDCRFGRCTACGVCPSLGAALEGGWEKGDCT